MFKRLRHAIAVRHLAYLQRHNAYQLQHLLNVRAGLDIEEKMLHRRAQQLAIREIDLSVTARRKAREAARA